MALFSPFSEKKRTKKKTNEIDFGRLKASKICGVDLSRKGTIDDAIVSLVAMLNGHDAYVTTSSCSGRIIVVSQDGDGDCVQKKQCRWVMNSHDTIDAAQLEESVSKGNAPNAVLKFEPFILHVLCRRLEDARSLHVATIESGFRNSGLTLGKNGKIVLAVRSTHGLEVPLTNADSLLMVDSSYLRFIAERANQRFRENQRRIERFYEAVKNVIANDDVNKSSGAILSPP